MPIGDVNWEGGGGSEKSVGYAKGKRKTRQRQVSKVRGKKVNTKGSDKGGPANMGRGGEEERGMS